MLGRMRVQAQTGPGDPRGAVLRAHSRGSCTLAQSPVFLATPHAGMKRLPDNDVMGNKSQYTRSLTPSWAQRGRPRSVAVPWKETCDCGIGRVLTPVTSNLGWHVCESAVPHGKGSSGCRRGGGWQSPDPKMGRVPWVIQAGWCCHMDSSKQREAQGAGDTTAETRQERFEEQMGPRPPSAGFEGVAGATALGTQLEKMGALVL